MDYLNFLQLLGTFKLAAGKICLRKTGMGAFWQPNSLWMLTIFIHGLESKWQYTSGPMHGWVFSVITKWNNMVFAGVCCLNMGKALKMTSKLILILCNAEICKSKCYTGVNHIELQFKLSYTIFIFICFFFFFLVFSVNKKTGKRENRKN